MSTILAVKNGIQKRFSQVAWDLLGKDKSGYVIVPTEAQKKQAKKDAEKEAKGKPDAGPIATTVKTSKDYAVDGVIIEAKKIETIEGLQAFATGETRENVIEILKRRNAEIVEALAAPEVPNAPGTPEVTEEDELTAKYQGPFSNDEGTNVREANAHIDTLETVEAINLYVPTTEERETVLKHKAKRIEELTK